MERGSMCSYLSAPGILSHRTLWCPVVSSCHLLRGQGEVQSQQTLQFLFHPMMGSCFYRGLPGDGGEGPCAEVSGCLSFSQTAFLSGQRRGLRGSLGLLYVCMCGEILHSFPVFFFKKNKAFWAMPFSLASVRYSKLALLRWHGCWDLLLKGTFTHWGLSLWEDKASGLPGAKHWPKWCLPVSSHTFVFSILDWVSSPILHWKRHTGKIRVLVFNKIGCVHMYLFPKVAGFHWRRDSSSE